MPQFQEIIMKLIRIAAIATVALVFSGGASAECFGWVLKYSKKISVTETLCDYEKSGVQQKVIVNGFCPFSPPGC
jgi:hypothetical protein